MIKVLLRLPVPEGRYGDTVVVSEARARVLIDAGYAKFLETVGADTTYEAPPAASAPPSPTPSDSPVVDLPATNAPKAEWVDVAETLGIETEGLTKIQVVEAVTDVVG